MAFSEEKRTSYISSDNQEQRLLPVEQAGRGARPYPQLQWELSTPFPPIQNSVHCNISLFKSNGKIQCIVLTSLLL